MTELIYKVSDSSGHIAPFVNISAQVMFDLFIVSAQGLRTLTYGTRTIEGAAPPHDHGQEGGEVWPEVISISLKRPFLFVWEDAAMDDDEKAVLRGETEVRPGMLGYKLVLLAPVLLRAGWREVQVRVSFFDGIGDPEVPYLVALTPLELAQSLTPSNPEGYPIAQGTFAVQLLEAAFSVATCDLDSDEIDKLGDVRLDRLVELRVWQTDLAPSGTAAHLLSLCLYPTEVSTEARQPESRDRPRAQVLLGDLISGALTPDLTQSMRDVLNQESIGLLGRAPGLDADETTPDRRVSFRQDIQAPHQHQGVLVPDGDGGFFSDGADLRLSTCGVYTSSELFSDFTMEPARGVAVGRPSSPASWMRFRRRISVAAGCAALDLNFSLGMGFEEGARGLCVVRVGLFPIGVTPTPQPYNGIITALSSGKRQSATRDEDGYHTLEVDPREHPAYERNRARELSGKAGHWSRDAMLSKTFAPPIFDVQDESDLLELPSGAERIAYPHRISQPVRIHLTHPARVPGATPHPTQDYALYLRWSIETPDDDVPGFDSEAQLYWWHLRPAPEWALAL